MPHVALAIPCLEGCPVNLIRAAYYSYAPTSWFQKLDRTLVHLRSRRLPAFPDRMKWTERCRWLLAGMDLHPAGIMNFNWPCMLHTARDIQAKKHLRCMLCTRFVPPFLRIFKNQSILNLTKVTEKIIKIFDITKVYFENIFNEESNNV